MGLLSRTGDIYYTFRFLRLLTTPWTEMGAFKLGLIDAQGNILKKPVTDEERSKYNLFHRLVFNLKKLLNKVPLGKNTLASYLAALYLIKEDTGISENSLVKILKHTSGVDVSSMLLTESCWNLVEDGTKLRPGNYCLRHDIMLPKSGELLAVKNTRVRVDEDCAPVGSILGTPVFEVYHHRLRRGIYVTQHDIIN